MDLNHNSNQFTQPPEVASNGWAQCGDDMKSSRRRVFLVVVEGQALAATNPLSHVLWLACDRRLRAFSAISLAPVPDKRFTAHRSHSPCHLNFCLTLSPRLIAPRKHLCLDADVDQFPHTYTPLKAACLTHQHANVIPKWLTPRPPSPRPQWRRAPPHRAAETDPTAQRARSHKPP